VLLAVGPGVDPDGLQLLSTQLSRRFSLRSRVMAETLESSFAYDAVRNQYYSTQILNRLSALEEDGDRILGVAAVDLFVPILTFVFGEAQLNGSAAVISSHRLRERFYGLPAQVDLENSRILKEAVHELGHTFGLRHCSDWRCVMSSSHDVGRIDVKNPDFCVGCGKVVAASGQKV
jgi:archaemetzincin